MAKKDKETKDKEKEKEEEKPEEKKEEKANEGLSLKELIERTKKMKQQAKPEETDDITLKEMIGRLKDKDKAKEKKKTEKEIEEDSEKKEDKEASEERKKYEKSGIELPSEKKEEEGLEYEESGFKAEPIISKEDIDKKEGMQEPEAEEAGKEIKEEKEKALKDKEELLPIGEEVPAKEKGVKELEESEKKLITSYANSKIYRIKGSSLMHYQVPVPRPTASEKAIISTIKEAATRLITIAPYRIRNPEERRNVYFNRIMEILRASKELNIPSKRYEFYANAVVREMVGYGLIDDLIKDDKLEEIMIISARRPVYVFHREYGMMTTNIEFFNDEEINDLINRIARGIGRRVDISSPLLDARLADGSRVNATIAPASVSGSTLTIRKFRDDPYSIIDLVKMNTINTELAAFLWLAVEGLGVKPANILISGGTGSGKTTTLNVLASFIPSNERIITIEDSVSYDSEIFVFENDNIKKVKIGELIDSQFNVCCPVTRDSGHEVIENTGDIETLCFDQNGKIARSKIREFIRHKTNKQMYEITLTSGKKIEITGDHCLFWLNEQGEIGSVKTNELQVGHYIATPRALPLYSAPLEFVPYWHALQSMNRAMVCSDIISKRLKKIKNEKLFAFTNGKTNESKRNTVNLWRRNSSIPITVFNKMKEENIFQEKDFEAEHLFLKNIRNNMKIPLKLPLTENFLEFFGLWLADGCYDLNSVIVSVKEQELQNLVIKVAEELDIAIKKHSDSFSLMLNSSLLKKVMMHIMELKGDSFTKETPSWVHNLSNEQIAAFIRGYFSGDGTSGKHEIEWTSCSKQLMKDIQSLLLRLGIRSRIASKRYKRDKSFKGRISGYKNIRLFLDKIGFIPLHKQQKASLTLKNEATHAITDIIPISASLLKEYKQLPHYYRSGRSNIGRRFLQTLTLENQLNKLEKLSNNDVFWDQIKEIRKLKIKEQYVYDLSVPGYENFICNNIFVHNTAELNLPLQHWIRLEARPPGLEGKGELTLDILTKNALRMRPDRIIVGEVRHKEASTLFTAMNTGHPGSMGTIHSNSPQETIVRVTNPPMEVPELMLSSLDLILVQHRLHDRKKGTIRRMTEVAEVIGVLEGKLQIQTLFERNASQDTLIRTPLASNYLKQVSELSGISMNELNEEIENREKIIKEIIDKDTRDISKVAELTEEFISKERNISG